MHNFLNKALQLLRKHDFLTSLEQRHCAMIVRGGAIISTGYNSHDTNSFVQHYTRMVGQHKCHTTHAEMDAIKQVRSKTDLRGCKIFVARICLGSKKPGLARPCNICERVLYEYGITRAIYTISEEEYGVMKILAPKNTIDRTVMVENAVAV